MLLRNTLLAKEVINTQFTGYKAWVLPKFHQCITEVLHIYQSKPGFANSPGLLVSALLSLELTLLRSPSLRVSRSELLSIAANDLSHLRHDITLMPAARTLIFFCARACLNDAASVGCVGHRGLRPYHQVLGSHEWPLLPHSPVHWLGKFFMLHSYALWYFVD
jgi:hypothetical protein